MTVNCKELEERLTQLNQSLGFRSFCEKNGKRKQGKIFEI